MIALASPWWLLLLLLLPALAVHHHRRRVGAGALTYSRIPEGSTSAWRLHLPFYCRLLALALLVTALARPQLGTVEEEITTIGLDLQIALDISGSMGAEDLGTETRLAIAKDVIGRFVRERPGDRIGLVTFAGTALTKVPPTLDHAALASLVESVRLHALPDGTAIGLALATAAARLEDSDAASRLVILVTDGDNNTGQIDPMAAAALCDGLGVRVYTIAVGTEDGPVTIPVPVRDERTGQTTIRRVRWNVRVDEELLSEIADRTAGRFYRAADPTALRRIFADIDELETSPVEVTRTMRRRELFSPLASAALGLLLLPLGTALTGLTLEP